MKTFFRKHLKLLVIAPVALVLIAAIVIAFNQFVPSYRIGSGSMGKTIPVGSFVFLGPADNLEPRDVITFQKEGDVQPTTHTFIGYAEDGSLMTKGDANPTPDLHEPPLTIDDVEGEVILMLTPMRQLVLLIVVIAVILLLTRDPRKRDKPETTQSDTSRVTNPA